jgi:Xaa-Pro aminopeptidase
MRVELRRLTLPDTAAPPDPPPTSIDEYTSRLRALTDAAGSDWVAVYGDREHFANLLYLIGFDPRFEEALLLLGPDERRVLLLGNEGVLYAAIVAVPVEIALCQSFSLPAQPRQTAPNLAAVLREVGLKAGDRVGVVGWKYLEPAETDDPRAPAFVPAAIVRDLRRVTGGDPVDLTSLLLHPVDGLRARNSAAMIAFAEAAATRSAEAVLRIVRGVEPGMSEREMAALMGYAGEPMTIHPVIASGARGEPINGLRSATSRRIGRGDGAVAAVGFWGSLCCRAGLVGDGPDEEFLATVVRPYYATLATWYATARVGVTGGEVEAAIAAALAENGAPFGSLLNPGHLTGHDEWLHSPVRPGSSEPLRSGALFQADIIPTPLPPGIVLNCEDTVALADQALRDELARDHPDLWRRVTARRAFMQDELGLTLSPDLLPLSPAAAYLPPFWLADDLVCTVAG